MGFTVSDDDWLNLLNDVLGFIDGPFEAWLLRLDFNADLDIIFGLLDLVFDIENDSSAFFYRCLLDLDC